MSSRRSTVRAFAYLSWLVLAVVACSPVLPRGSSDYATLSGVSVPVETYVLDNGLTVIAHVDHTSPFVAVHLRYRVGAADETPGKEGLAHLVEHLMFDGSRHVAASEFFDELRVSSSDVNAETSFDATTYHEIVPANRLETALWLESDRMAFPLEPITNDGFARERRVVKNELRERRARGPYAAAPPLLYATLFPVGHPYHVFQGGSEQTLDRTNLDDARAFIRAWYAPNNAALVLVGDFDPGQARPLIEKYFGAIVPHAVPPRASRKQASTSGDQRIAVEHGGGKAYVAIAWELPSELSEGVTAMVVAGDALGGNVRRAAVDEDKVAGEVSVFLDRWRIASVFMLVASVREGHTHEQVLASIDRALDVARGPNFFWAPRSWRNLLTSATMQAIYSLEDYSSRAAMLSSYEDLSGTANFIGSDLQMRRSVRTHEARDAYYQYLPFDHRVVGFFVPRDGAPREGRVVSK